MVIVQNKYCEPGLLTERTPLSVMVASLKLVIPNKNPIKKINAVNKKIDLVLIDFLKGNLKRGSIDFWIILIGKTVPNWKKKNMNILK